MFIVIKASKGSFCSARDPLFDKKETFFLTRTYCTYVYFGILKKVEPSF